MMASLWIIICNTFKWVLKYGNIKILIYVLHEFDFVFELTFCIQGIVPHSILTYFKCSIPVRYESFWKELDGMKHIWRNRKDIKVEDVGIAALFGLELYAWSCVGEIVGRGFTFTGYYVWSPDYNAIRQAVCLDFFFNSWLFHNESFALIFYFAHKFIKLLVSWTNVDP